MSYYLQQQQYQQQQYMYGQNDIESQKTNIKQKQPNKNKNMMNQNTIQSEGQDDEQNDKNKKSFFQKFRNLFKSKEIEYSGEWMENDIIKQINDRKENHLNIKKFIQNIEANNKFLYQKTCEFQDGMNAACEKYFYTQDQKKTADKKFSKSNTKRFKLEKEMTVVEYEKKLSIRKTIIQKQQEEMDNINSHNSQGLSFNIKNMEQQQQQIQKQESLTNSILKKSNPLPSLFSKNPASSFNESNKSTPQDKENDQLGQLKKGKLKGGDNFDDDFSLEQSNQIGGKTLELQQQFSNQKDSVDENKNDGENDNDDDDKSGSDDSDEEGQKEKERKEQDDDEEEEEDEDEDDDGDSNSENSENESDEDNSDEDDDEEQDSDDDDNDNSNDTEKKKQKKQDKENKQQDENNQQQLKKSQQDVSQISKNLELLKGSSIVNQSFKNSISIRYSKAATLNEPRFYEIVKDKVERIRIEDIFNNNIISFRILDQNVDSYIPDLMNRLITLLYTSAFFNHTLYSIPQEFNIFTENDPVVKQLIRGLSVKAKNASFVNRAIEQLKYFTEEGEEIKNLLKVVKQNIEQEQFQKYSYSLTGNSEYGARFKQNYERAKKIREDSEQEFKEKLGKYLFHREEDLYYFIYHMFNKQLCYHSNSLDDINKFDRWILVNQGDLEKMKEKKKKNEQIKEGEEKEMEVDQMKIVLEEVDKYLQIISTSSNVYIPKINKSETTNKKKKSSKK